MGALNLSQIAENQTSAYVTSNDADATLEKALCDCKLDHDASAGDFIFSTADFVENWCHKLGGAAVADYNLTVPAISRPFMVINESGHTATLSTGAGSSAHVSDNENRLFYCDGTNVLALSDTSGEVVGASGFSGALVTLSSDMSVTNTDASYPPVTWGAEEYDTNDFHSTLTNTGRFTIPAGVSKITLSAQVIWDSNSSGDRAVFIHKNGNGDFAGRPYCYQETSTTFVSSLKSPPLAVVENDYFELKVWQNSGATRSLLQDYKSWFSIEVIE